MRVKIAQPSAKTIVTQLELVGLPRIFYTGDINLQNIYSAFVQQPFPAGKQHF